MHACSWPKTLLIVSHAREFLNTVCTDILHLHSRKLTTYKVRPRVSEAKIWGKYEAKRVSEAKTCASSVCASHWED